MRLPCSYLKLNQNLPTPPVFNTRKDNLTFFVASLCSVDPPLKSVNKSESKALFTEWSQTWSITESEFIPVIKKCL